MRRRLLAYPLAFLCLSFFLASPALANNSAGALARLAVSEKPSESASAIAELRAILGDPPRREHRPLDTVVNDRERGVNDPAIRVHGHPGREVEVLGVAVEPEAVVVVRVAARGVRDRQRGLVDRIVVERCQHAGDGIAQSRARRRSGGPDSGRRPVP